jgi:hypothetical protein
MLDTGCSMLDTRYWILDTRCKAFSVWCIAYRSIARSIAHSVHPLPPALCPLCALPYAPCAYNPKSAITNPKSKRSQIETIPNPKSKIRNRVNPKSKIRNCQRRVLLLKMKMVIIIPTRIYRNALIR